MKLSKVIITSALASTLMVGVLVGSNIHNQDRSVNAATETTVYYAIPSADVGTYSVKLNVNFKGDGEDWHIFDMTRDGGYKTQNGLLLYTCTYTDAYNGVGCMQFKLFNGSVEVSQQQPIGKWTVATEYNGKVYVHNTGWVEYDPDDTYYTLSRYKVLTEYDSSSKEGPYLIDELVVPAGYVFNARYGAYVYGREWRGWFDDPTLSDYVTSDLVINSDVSIYGEYYKVERYPVEYKIDLSDSGWADGEADYAIMFFNDVQYYPVAQEWSEYVENVPAGTKLVSIPCHNHFDALKFTIVRYNKDNTKENWENDRWAYVWNQTEDSYNSQEGCVRIGGASSGNKNYIFDGCPGAYERIWNEETQAWEWQSYSFGILNHAKVNGSNHAEFFNDVEFEYVSSFRIGVAPYNEQYDYYANFQLDPSVPDDSFELDANGNIKCLIPGTYSFYFDANSHNLYITRQGNAEAEGWCQGFLELVLCDASGKELPANWDSVEYQYEHYLSEAAQDIIYAADANPNGTIIERAMARYDIAVKNHSDLSRFVKSSGGSIRPISALAYSYAILNGNNSGSIIVVIIASTITFGIVLGYIFFRKKNEHK